MATVSEDQTSDDKGMWHTFARTIRNHIDRIFIDGVEDRSNPFNPLGIRFTPKHDFDGEIDDVTVTEITPENVGKMKPASIGVSYIDQADSLTPEAIKAIQARLKERGQDHDIWFRKPHMIAQEFMPRFDVDMPGEPMLKFNDVPKFASGGYVSPNMPFPIHGPESVIPRDRSIFWDTHFAYQPFGPDVYKMVLKRLKRRKLRVKPSPTDILRRSTIRYATSYRLRPGRS